MNKILFSVLLTLATLPAWAQSTAAMGKVDVDVERARLAAERAEVDKAFSAQRGVCFKRFSVESCLAESRRQKREAIDHIKRQEAVLNDAERKRRGSAALDRLEEKASTQRTEEAAAEREKALQAQRDREQRAKDHDASRAGLAAQEGAKAKQFQDKQRAYAERQAKQAERSAQGASEAKLQQDKLQKAEAHRADVEQKNAARTKPRSAPLPPPPP